MTPSRLQQTASFKTSGYREQTRSDASDTVHHELGPHCSSIHYQYQEDSFKQASDFEALIPQLPSTLPYDAPPWNTQVDGLPTLGCEFLPSPNDYLASPTSSITPPPSLPNANQFSSEPFQNFTTPMGGLLPQETIHREQSSVHDPFSNTLNEKHIVGQMATPDDRVHRTFCIKPPSPESRLAEIISSSVSNEMKKSHVSTLLPQKIENG